MRTFKNVSNGKLCSRIKMHMRPNIAQKLCPKYCTRTPTNEWINSYVILWRRQKRIFHVSNFIDIIVQIIITHYFFLNRKLLRTIGLNNYYYLGFFCKFRKIIKTHYKSELVLNADLEIWMEDLVHSFRGAAFLVCLS